MTTTLRLVLDGDSKKLLSELAKSGQATAAWANTAKKRSDILTDGFTKLRNIVGAIFVGKSLTGLVSWVRQTAEAQDQLGKFAGRIGFTVEGLSQLRYAAELSGVTVESLQMSLQRATRRMSEFAKTGKGEAAEALKELGLADAVKSGQTLEQLLPQLARKFQGLGDEASRVRLAQKLFDSEGVSLVQLLSQGPETIQRLMKEADRFGETITKRDAERAAALNDASRRFESAMTGVANAVVELAASPLTKSFENLASMIALISGQADRPIQPPEELSRTVQLNNRIRQLEEQIRTFRADNGDIFGLPGGNYSNQAALQQELAKLRRELASELLFLDLQFGEPGTVGGGIRQRVSGRYAEPPGAFIPTVGPFQSIPDSQRESLLTILSYDDQRLKQQSKFFEGLKSGSEYVATFADETANAHSAVVGLGYGLTGNVQNAMNSFIDGSAKGSVVIKQLAQDVTRSIQQMITQFLAFQLVGGLFRTFTAATPSGGPIDTAALPEGTAAGFTSGVGSGGFAGDTVLFKSGGQPAQASGSSVVNLQVVVNTVGAGTLEELVQRAIQQSIPRIAAGVRAYERRSTSFDKV